MSFLDLWDSFAEVRENWNENRNLIESFLDISRMRLEVERSHHKRLEKLCSHPFFKQGKNTMMPLIDKLKNFYAVKLTNSKNIMNTLNNEVIQPLRDLVVNQEVLIREKVEIGKKLEAERKRVTKLCENSKEKYWKACKETLLAVKNKQDYLKKEEESYDSYIKSIEVLNRFFVLFVEDMGKNLMMFQVSEEERLKHLRESFRKFIETEDTYLRSILPEIESIPIVTQK